MNREIKFRGKRLDSGKWAYGKGVVFLPEENLAMVIEQVKGNLSQHTGVEPKTVGQYTRRKDKSGVEIYEGDRILYKGFKLKLNKGGVKKLVEGKFTIKDITDYEAMSALISFDELEVIGNIHETPKT